MSDWAMREYEEDDGFLRWPRRPLGQRRAGHCKAHVLTVIDDQQAKVRQYLELLRARNDLSRAVVAPAPLALAAAEADFTSVARAYGRRHGIDVETWIAVRVPRDVLVRAGVILPDGTRAEGSLRRNRPR